MEAGLPRILRNPAGILGRVLDNHILGPAAGPTVIRSRSELTVIG